MKKSIRLSRPKPLEENGEGHTKQMVKPFFHDFPDYRENHEKLKKFLKSKEDFF